MVLFVLLNPRTDCGFKEETSLVGSAALCGDAERLCVKP